MNQFFVYFSYTTLVVLLFSCFIGAYRYHQVSPLLRWGIVYLFSMLLMDLAFRYFGLVASDKYNLFLFPLLALFEFITWSVIFYRFLFKKSKVLLVIVAVGSGLLLLDGLFLSKLFVLEQYQTYSRAVSNLTIIIFSLLYYYKSLKAELPNISHLRLNSGIFIYSAINLLVFSSLNFLVNESINLVVAFWVLNVVASSIFYLFLTYQIWQHGKIHKPLQYG